MKTMRFMQCSMYDAQIERTRRRGGCTSIRSPSQNCAAEAVRPVCMQCMSNDLFLADSPQHIGSCWIYCSGSRLCTRQIKTVIWNCLPQFRPVLSTCRGNTYTLHPKSTSSHCLRRQPRPRRCPPTLYRQPQIRTARGRHHPWITGPHPTRIRHSPLLAQH